MPNPYFSFKQFTVQQDRCAMKVCTDACLFGAWVASQVKDLPITVNHVLDIGTGTGLLSLMLAQETTAYVDAVEIDPQAAEQATENFSSSPWADRLKVFNSSVQDFQSTTAFDLVISNPPFFENDLPSADNRRNDAKHNTGLLLEELIKIMKSKVSGRGYCAVLLPFHRMKYFEMRAKEENLYLLKSMLVKQTVAHSFFRACLLFSAEKRKEADASELCIHTAERKYSEGFINLLRPYYLHL